MTYETILYEVSDRVATITLNRPEQLNTVPFHMIDELLHAIDHAEADDEVRVVIVTGAGRVFCGGTDLSASGGGLNPGDPGYQPLRGTGRDIGGEVSLRLYDSKKPWIAAINGPAVGYGCSFVLPMDIRIASDKARFAFLFARRGIVPESCASWFLPRIVGISRALSWTVSGRNIPVQEALATGLIEEIVPHEQLMDRARAIARDIATQAAPVSVALTRQLMYKMLSAPHPIEANRLESLALKALVPGPDAREGVRAFREKRDPAYQLKPSSDMPDFYPWFDQPAFRR